MADAVFRVSADVTALQTAKRQTERVLNDMSAAANKTTAAISRSTSSAQASMGRGASGGRGAWLSGAAGMVGGYIGLSSMSSLLRSSVSEASEFNRANMRLKMASARAGLSGRERARMSEFVSSTEISTGQDDARTATMLGKLIAAGERDVSNAMKKVKLALDVEAAGFADADSTLNAMTKAGADNERQLKLLATNIGVQVTDGMSLSLVLQRMSEATEQAAEKVHRAGGVFAEFDVTWKNVKQSIGENLMAAYTPLIRWINDRLASTNDSVGIDERRNMAGRVASVEDGTAGGDNVMTSLKRDIRTRANRGSITQEEAERRRKLVTEAYRNATAASGAARDSAIDTLVRANRGNWGDGGAVTGAPTVAGEFGITKNEKPSRVANGERGGVVQRVEISVHAAGATPSPLTVRGR